MRKHPTLWTVILLIAGIALGVAGMYTNNIRHNRVVFQQSFVEMFGKANDFNEALYEHPNDPAVWDTVGVGNASLCQWLSWTKGCPATATTAVEKQATALKRAREGDFEAMRQSLVGSWADFNDAVGQMGGEQSQMPDEMNQPIAKGKIAPFKNVPHILKPDSDEDGKLVGVLEELVVVNQLLERVLDDPEGVRSVESKVKGAYEGAIEPGKSQSTLGIRGIILQHEAVVAAKAGKYDLAKKKSYESTSDFLTAIAVLTSQAKNPA